MRSTVSQAVSPGQQHELMVALKAAGMTDADRERISRKKGLPEEILDLIRRLDPREPIKRSEAEESSIVQDNQLLSALIGSGMTPADAQIVIEGGKSGLLDEILATVRLFGYTRTPSQQEARSIMGGNYFGVEEAVRLLGVGFTGEDHRALAVVPFREEVLKRLSGSHVLIAGANTCYGRVMSQFPWDQKDRRRMATEGFPVDEPVQVRWYLVRTAVLTASIGQPFERQAQLMSPDEELLSMSEAAYCLVAILHQTESLRLRWDPGASTVTSSFSPDGDRIAVGVEAYEGGQREIDYDYGYEDHRQDHVGLLPQVRCSMA